MLVRYLQLGPVLEYHRLRDAMSHCVEKWNELDTMDNNLHLNLKEKKNEKNCTFGQMPVLTCFFVLTDDLLHLRNSHSEIHGHKLPIAIVFQVGKVLRYKKCKSWFFAVLTRVNDFFRFTRLINRSGIAISIVLRFVMKSKRTRILHFYLNWNRHMNWYRETQFATDMAREMAVNVNCEEEPSLMVVQVSMRTRISNIMTYFITAVIIP